MRALVPFTCVAAVSFLFGFGAMRCWSSANSSGINQIKAAIHNAKTAARAMTAESNTERLIALCEKPGSLSRAILRTTPDSIMRD